MAHGNASDFVAFSLIAAAVQLVWFLPTLFDDFYLPFNTLKATFVTSSPDLELLSKFTAGLLLVIAFMFFSIKWNPGNGKMTGLACWICAGCSSWNMYQSDSNMFVPRLLYVYCAVLALGGVHTFFFPSNPKVSDVMGKANTKNNHGNFSDKAFFALFAFSMLCYFYPDHLYQDYGPIKATFSTRTADLDTLVRFTAGLLFIVGMTFSGVKWNPVCGKLPGLGCFVCAGYIAYTKYIADAAVFVPGILYLYAAVLFLGGLHIFAFPSNPLVVPPKGKGD